MNISNILTILRLILAVIVMHLLVWSPFSYSIYYAFIIFLLAVSTDYLDGVYARKRNLVSDFGKLMDPIADKLLILLTLTAFTYLNIVRGWMVALIALREISITIIRIYLFLKGEVLAAKEPGKYKTFCQMVAVTIIFTILIFLKEARYFNYDGSILQIIVDLIMLVLVVITLSSAVIYIKGLRTFTRGGSVHDAKSYKKG